MFYKYHGRVKRVVDADTVDAELDLGFGIKMHQRFRIDGFDAPETWRPRNEAEKNHGAEATMRAIQLLAEEDLIFLTTKTARFFDQYRAQIRLKDGRDYGNVMIAEGFSKKETYDEITIPKGD